MPTQYRVHRFDICMSAAQSKLELFLNSLEGEIAAIIPEMSMDSESILTHGGKNGSRRIS